MNITKKRVVASIALALGMSSAAIAATQKEEDSAYQWGRWAVLSPAAGGSEPYIAGVSPVSQNSPRPETAPEFEPEILDNDTPVVDGFCTAGADCGYATYYKSIDGEGQGEGDRVEIEAALEGFDQTDENPNGPVLARFNLEKSPIEQSCDGYCGDEQLREVAADFDGGEGDQVASFEVSAVHQDDSFPDIQSVEMVGSVGYFSGSERSRVTDISEDGTVGVGTSVITTKTSTLEETFDFQEVDTGIWTDETETRTRITRTDSDGVPIQLLDFSDPAGFFVYGRAATIEQMEAFTAGNVVAVYQGMVLDYESAVTMEFDFGENVVHGVFASENGFNGFHGHGQIDGINFSGSDGDNKFLGSLLNGAENASGAVTNGSQLGVYSADHVH